MEFPAGGADFTFGPDEAQYIFTDTELDNILNAVEDHVRGGSGGGGAEQVFLDNFLGGDDSQQPLPLQFQPRSLETHGPANSLSAAAAAQDAVASVPLGGALGGAPPLPGEAAPSACAAPVQPHSAVPSSAMSMPAMTSTTLASGVLMSGAISSPQGTAVTQATLATPGLPGIPHAAGMPPGLSQPPTLPLGFPQLMVQVLPAQAALAAHLQQQQQQQQQQQSIAAALAPQLAAAAAAAAVHGGPMAPPMAPPAPAQARVASPTYRHTGRAQASEGGAGSRAPVSHSTVEKQRRDRINGLIDELRDLVPPTQQQQQQQQQIGLVTIGASDNPEASSRRPKHVVLADTINLLKALRQRVSFAAVTAEMQQLPAGGSGGGGGALPLPVPMPVPGMYGAVAGAGVVPGMPGSSAQPVKQEPQGSSSQEDDDMGCSGGPGVTVKKGPDCFYVQVTCPDRKGLLSDITDTLRNLSLEVRTAAVTTNGGSVRDVFEVVPPDGAATLAPEAVQSLVKGALSQRVAEGQQEVTAGKRPRA